MSSITERYDRASDLYGLYWAPVLEATGHRLLDRLLPPPGPGARILDIGTGNGSLAIEVARRWPAVLVIACDASSGMVDSARARAREELPGDAFERINFVHADADRLPLADGSVEVCVSSFVLQLVPDRTAALSEARRVLVPRGRLSFVTWLEERGGPFPPADEYDEAVLDLEIDEREGPEEDRAGDFASPRAAVTELRQAGFRDVRARADWLDFHWTLDSYLEYKERYDERGLFAELSEHDRERLRAGARRRLERLDGEDFHWRSAVVFASARKP